MDEKLAAQIIKKIGDDLSDRSGFDLGSLDRETQKEIRDTWTRIILDTCAAHTAALSGAKP